MAGNYPDAPAPRMAYDTDGTIAFRVLGGNPITTYGPDSGTIRVMNNESSDLVDMTYGSSGAVYVGVVFPQQRDISGVYVSYNQVSSATLYYSTDTTSGIDGAWAVVPGASVIDSSVQTSYRSSISTVSLSGVTGLRVRRPNGYGGGNGLRALHVYGSLSAGQTPDRLRQWHPTLDEPLDENNSADGAYLDWGNVPRGTTQERSFRIKNNSATLTANSIVVSNSILTDTSPTLNNQITYSDGGAFANSINIGNLVPGEISAEITVRRTISLSANMGPWSVRTIAEAGSWT